MPSTDEQHLAALRTYWKRHQAFSPMPKLCEVAGGAYRSYQSSTFASECMFWALRNFSSSNATMASFGQSARRPI